MDRITQEAYQRQRILKWAEKKSVTAAAIRYKVSRKTVYKWRKRYDGTLESLKERSRAPHHIARKQRVALLRLQYGVDLDEEMRDYYQKYVSRSIKDILRMCMREERMDWIKVCEEVGVLRKAAVEYAIEQATAEKKPAFTAFFLEYQNKHFPLKAGEDNTGLCLPDLPKEKKKKTVDKTSEDSI